MSTMRYGHLRNELFTVRYRYSRFVIFHYLSKEHSLTLPSRKHSANVTRPAVPLALYFRFYFFNTIEKVPYLPCLCLFFDTEPFEFFLSKNLFFHSRLNSFLNIFPALLISKLLNKSFGCIRKIGFYYTKL